MELTSDRELTERSPTSRSIVGKAALSPANVLNYQLQKLSSAEATGLPPINLAIERRK